MSLSRVRRWFSKKIFLSSAKLQLRVTPLLINVLEAYFLHMFHTYTQSVHCFLYWVSNFLCIDVVFDVRVVLTRGSFRLNYCNLPNVGLVPLVGVWRTRHTPRQTLHNPAAITGATHTHTHTHTHNRLADVIRSWPVNQIIPPHHAKVPAAISYMCRFGWAIIRCCVYVAEIWVTTKSSWLARAVWKVCRYCAMCKSIARQFSQFCQSIHRQQNTAQL